MSGPRKVVWHLRPIHLAVSIRNETTPQPGDLIPKAVPMNPINAINMVLLKKPVSARTGRRPPTKRPSLESLESRAMMAGDAQLDAAPEAVVLLDATNDAGRGQCELLFTFQDEKPGIIPIHTQTIDKTFLWTFHHGFKEVDHSMTFYRHDLPEQYIPPGGTPYWPLEAIDGQAMLDDTWYRLPSGDFVSKSQSADIDLDGRADVFSYRYANMHDYGPPQGSVWICGGFYSRVSHTAIYDWNENGPQTETYVPPAWKHDSEQLPVTNPDGVDCPASPTDAPANTPIEQCYSSPVLWQAIWSDIGSSQDQWTPDATPDAPFDATFGLSPDENVESPAISDPTTDVREDGWQDAVIEGEQSDTTDPADDTLTQAVVEELSDPDLLPQLDPDYA